MKKIGPNEAKGVNEVREPSEATGAIKQRGATETATEILEEVETKGKAMIGTIDRVLVKVENGIGMMTEIGPGTGILEIAEVNIDRVHRRR